MVSAALLGSEVVSDGHPAPALVGDTAWRLLRRRDGPARGPFACLLVVLVPVVPVLVRDAGFQWVRWQVKVKAAWGQWQWRSKAL